MRWLSALRAACLTVFVSGCSGGGCSSCAGGAIGPVPGGLSLTPDPRVPHAVQVRLTAQGLSRIQAAGPDLIVAATGGRIDIPTLYGNFGVGRYIVCRPPQTCRLDLVAPALDLALRPPDGISVRLRTGLRGAIPLHTCSLACSDRCAGIACLDADTTFPIDTARQSPMYIGLRTALTLRRDRHAERRDYLRADLVAPTMGGPLVEEDPMARFDVASISCTGALCPLFPLIRGTLVDTFRGTLGTAVDPIRDALAHASMPSPPGCPTGTRADGARCRYSDNELVPSLLGAEMTGNFGALLSSFSAGVRADVDFAVAAGDPTRDAEVTAEGATLNLFGVARSRGHSVCVPRVTAPAMPTIPEWPSLRRNVVPGTTRTPDLALGLAEGFLNHSLFNLWDAGMFCLGVTSSIAPMQLTSGTFSIVIPSIRSVVYPSTGAPLALTLRPQRPPQLTVLTSRPTPTSPLFELRFERLALDLYVWSEERYVRALTVTTDATIPVGLTEMMGLRPVIGTVATAQTTVTNNVLVSETPMRLATSLEAILGVAFGQLGGSIPAIALPSIPIPGPMGAPVGTVDLQLPEGSLLGVEEMSSRFLGLYPNLRYTPMRRSLEIPADTGATLVEEGARHVGDAVRVRADRGESIVPGEHEYAWRVDGMTWSHWTRDAALTVRSDAFELPGEHRIEVVSRRIGDASSLDPDPVVLTVNLAARDPRPAVGVATPEPLLIRGGPSTDAASGCGCRAPTGGDRRGTWVAAAVLALAVARRRRPDGRGVKSMATAKTTTAKNR